MLIKSQNQHEMLYSSSSYAKTCHERMSHVVQYVLTERNVKERVKYKRAFTCRIKDSSRLSQLVRRSGDHHDIYALQRRRCRYYNLQQPSLLQMQCGVYG